MSEWKDIKNEGNALIKDYGYRAVIFRRETAILRMDIRPVLNS